MGWIFNETRGQVPGQLFLSPTSLNYAGIAIPSGAKKLSRATTRLS